MLCLPLILPLSALLAPVTALPTIPHPHSSSTPEPPSTQIILHLTDTSSSTTNTSLTHHLDHNSKPPVSPWQLHFHQRLLDFLSGNFFILHDPSFRHSLNRHISRLETLALDLDSSSSSSPLDHNDDTPPGPPPTPPTLSLPHIIKLLSRSAPLAPATSRAENLVPGYIKELLLTALNEQYIYLTALALREARRPMPFSWMSTPPRENEIVWVEVHPDALPRDVEMLERRFEVLRGVVEKVGKDLGRQLGEVERALVGVGREEEWEVGVWRGEVMRQLALRWWVERWEGRWRLLMD